MRPVLRFDVYLKHGLSQTPEYKCWQQLKARCLNPSHRRFSEYGGRGIQVHPAWVEDFEAFLAVVGQRPSPLHSLDRFPDRNGNYEPGNVRWATAKEQGNNRRPPRPRQPRSPRTRCRAPSNFVHGLSKTPEYRTWDAMKQRCLNPKNENYPRWGGAGVTVHGPWVANFTAFLQDVGPRPSLRHTLDRWPNPHGNYEPGNIRWATKAEQSRNRRSSKLDDAKVSAIRAGIAAGRSQRELSHELGVSEALISLIKSGERWA